MSNSSWQTRDFVYIPDADGYFARIGYTGSREPTVETLQAIQWHHLLAIPFETLDIHTIVDVALAPWDIEKKIVKDGRGGFCYENNILLLHVLRHLGYRVTPVISRTRWNRPNNIIFTPTHMILKVEIDGVLWLADAGFSSFGSPFPLRIETDDEQPTPLETRRITRDGEFYVHQLFFKEEWRDLYLFTLAESHPMDWEMGSFYVCNYPSCPAKLQIIVSMPTLTGRILLLDNVLSIRNHADGSTESRELETEAEYHEVLDSVFHLRLPGGTHIQPPSVTWK